MFRAFNNEEFHDIAQLMYTKCTLMSTNYVLPCLEPRVVCKDLFRDERRARPDGPHRHIDALAGGRRPLQRVVIDYRGHLGVESGQRGIVDAVVVDEDDAIDIVGELVLVEVVGKDEVGRLEVQPSEAVENLGPKVLLSLSHDCLNATLQLMGLLGLGPKRQEPIKSCGKKPKDHKNRCFNSVS